MWSTTSRATSATNRNSKGPRTDDGNRSPPPDIWEACPFRGHRSARALPRILSRSPGNDSLPAPTTAPFPVAGPFRSGCRQQWEMSPLSRNALGPCQLIVAAMLVIAAAMPRRWDKWVHPPFSSLTQKKIQNIPPHPPARGRGGVVAARRSNDAPDEPTAIRVPVLPPLLLRQPLVLASLLDVTGTSAGRTLARVLHPTQRVHALHELPENEAVEVRTSNSRVDRFPRR